MSKTKNDHRVKGVRLRQTRISENGDFEVIPGAPTGSLGLTAAYPKFERPNCKDDWRAAKLCPSGWVASDMIIHHRDDEKSRAVTGLSLECREIKVERICIQNC